MTRPADDAPRGPAARRLAAFAASPVGVAAILVAASVLVCWIGLGAYPLNKTEGHRAIPGWHVLETGELLPTRMFGTIYANKPPGMPWAIAASSAVFGETEFAARAPSALGVTLLALLSAWFTGRWFGRRAALAGGLGVLCMPTMWASARSADIEALLCLAAAVAIFPMVDVLARRPAQLHRRGLLGALAATGVVAGAALKGPALVPTILAAVGGVAIARRRAIALISPWLLAVLAAAGVAVSLLLWWFAGAIDAEEPIVRQQAGSFLWRPGRTAEILLLPVRAAALGAPVALALLFPWGPGPRREAGRDADGPAKLATARALAWTAALGFLIAAVIGLDNPRYALPTLVVLPPLAGYVVAGATGGFERRRAAIARAMLLGRPPVWPVLMIAAAAVYGVLIRPQGRDDGLIAGRWIAAAIAQDAPDRSDVSLWANNAVSDKPEILWYAQEHAADLGVVLAAAWARELADAVIPPHAGYLLLKPSELDRLGRPSELLEVGQTPGGRFVLIRVETVRRPVTRPSPDL